MNDMNASGWALMVALGCYVFSCVAWVVQWASRSTRYVAYICTILVLAGMGYVATHRWPT